MKDLWHKQEQARSSRREEVYAALQYVASFLCLVSEWKDSEELEPQPKEKWIFVDKKRVGNEASHRVVCGSTQLLVYEMWKRRQVHENAGTFCRTAIFVKEFGMMKKATYGRT